MSIHRILLWPIKGLSVTCESAKDLVTAPDVVEALKLTLVAADGAGLAAPQIGYAVRIVVVAVNGTLVLIDPEFEPDPAAPVVPMDEGCLSAPGISATVHRPAFGRLTYRDLTGQLREREVDGLESRAVQHEIDHLDGKMFWDRLSPLKRSLTTKKWLRQWKSLGHPPSWDPSPEPSAEQKAIVAQRAIRKQRERETGLRIPENPIVTLPRLLGPDGEPL